MSTPKRFTKGVTNVPTTETMGQFVSMDPTLLHTYFEDFDIYTAAHFTVTETSAGATEAITDGGNGLLKLSSLWM